MKLYEISQGFEYLLSLMEDPDTDLEMLNDTLESLEFELEEKAENIVKIMKSIEAQEKALKDEENRLSSRRKTFENKREGLKKYLQNNMELMKKDKIKTALFSINIQNNPPSVDIKDETKVPKKYKVKQPDKIDKKAILEDLKADIKVRGCEMVQGRSLRIR